MNNSQLLSKNNYKIYQRERIDAILKILEQHGYATVKSLTEALSYSTATINRDLNVMVKERLVKRSYGGVEPIGDSSVLLPFRYEKMKAAKQRIAKAAATLVEDGDTIFVDASTTTEAMGPYLLEKKELTVITNNMALVIFLSGYGVKVRCLGGAVVEPPYMLLGTETVANVRRFHADKMFFSTGGITADGTLSFGGMYEPVHEAMMENADRVVYLADHEKLRPSFKVKRDFSEVDVIVTDFAIASEVQAHFPSTHFLLASPTFAE